MTDHEAMQTLARTVLAGYGHGAQPLPSDVCTLAHWVESLPRVPEHSGWQVTVDVPEHMPDDERDELFTAVADAVHDLRFAEARGLDVSAGPRVPAETTEERPDPADCIGCYRDLVQCLRKWADDLASLDGVLSSRTVAEKLRLLLDTVTEPAGAAPTYGDPAPDTEDTVPCGQDNEHCGARRGTARCGGCTDMEWWD